MNCQALLFLAGSAPANVIAGGLVPVGTPARRISPRIENTFDSVTVKCGYYDIDVTITFTAAEAGDVTINLTENGIPVPGITATETVVTADTEVHNISLHGVVLAKCQPITLAIQNASESAITVTNVSFTAQSIN